MVLINQPYLKILPFQLVWDKHSLQLNNTHVF